ncbi:MAG: hypothetical protein ACXWDO_13135 [Bacteroidia bacterium]
MDLQSRKITFVQEFLRLQNENVIAKLEKILRREKSLLFEESLKPMSLEDFNSHIDKAVEDAENGNVISASDLKAKIKKWQ